MQHCLAKILTHDTCSAFATYSIGAYTGEQRSLQGVVGDLYAAQGQCKWHLGVHASCILPVQHLQAGPQSDSVPSSMCYVYEHTGTPRMASLWMHLLARV